MKDRGGIYAYAHYSEFRVSDESGGYRLEQIGTYDGTAGL